MNVQEIGALLKAERERQNLTIEDVVQRTKIGRTNIQAVEEGDNAHLPHAVYTKGFIRSYAQMLGVDIEDSATDIGAAYKNLSEPDETEQDLLAQEPAGLKKSTSLIVTSGGIFLIVVSLVLYFSFSSSEKQEKTPVEEKTVETSTAHEAVQPVIDQKKQQVEEPPVVEEKPVVSAEPASQTDEPSETTQEQVSPQPQDSGEIKEREEVAVLQEFSPAKDKRLIITAIDDCWLEASIDGKPFEVFLRPDEDITLEFSEELIVRLGNAGGVELVYNGKPYPINASAGQIKVINFSPR